MESLINFDGLGEIIINLTNKLADAVGWIANRETPNKIAINTYIQEIQEKDYDPVTKAALISNAKQIIKAYCNQNSIIEVAIQSLESSAKPEKIDNDWIGQFMDKAKCVSSKEFQWIWGKILARECNENGSVPLVLLYTLEKMDKEDAEVFTSLCRISVQIDETYYPLIIQSKIKEYDSLIGITLNNLLNLRSLGLIEMSFSTFSTGYQLVNETLPTKVIYFDEQYEILEDETTEIGNVIFTKSGQALCQSINVDKVEGFWETYCLPFFKKEESAREK